MSSSAEARRGGTIAWPIFALVLASVLVATAVFIAVTFSGPPPMARPWALPAIASALATGRQPADPGDPMGFATEPPPDGARGPRRRRMPELIVYTAQTAPSLRGRERADPARATRIAMLLGAAPATVVAASDDEHPDGGDFVFPDFTFAVRKGADWQVVRSRPRPLLTRWHWMTMAAMLGAILALALPAFALSRSIARPLRRLARAAEQARAGAALPPLPEGGSREVRELGHAVRSMHMRLASHAEGRTAMLGAIAHDLGTPLSRLAFWIEQLPEPAHGRASADIDEMRAMIAATLAFARDEAGTESASRLDLGALLDSLVEDMAVAGTAVSVRGGPRAVIRGDSVALRRLFANLVANAVRYGDRAELGWHVGDGFVTVHVDDAGPGIDPAQAERLFEPFVRGERSRNRATGGTGLGLAIVRSIASRHGGTATLGNIAGGARAEVRLPLSA